MKIPATLPVLLALCAFLALPLHAQYDMPDANQGPPPSNGPYSAPPPQQAPPPPDQQDAPDQQGDPNSQDATDQGAPDQSASFQTFYDNLAQQGTWVQSSDYGYVWQPNVNDPDWAPYTAGHWVYSDAGWTWASDEPWGWATYHYGRWVNLDGTGWCWVPGYTWAPAWVSWRYGDGYCGWAPLPPDSFVGIDYIGGGVGISVGFHIGGDCDSYYGIGAGCYHFIPCTYLGYSNYHEHYANRYNNYALINRTTNVTNLNVNHNGRHGNFGHVTTGGPSLAQINEVSQTPVQHVRLTNASRPGEGGRVANNSLALYAPHVAPGVSGQPTHVNGSINNATVNRGVDVTRPLAVNRNLATPAPTQTQIQAAQLAQYSAPPHAKVLTPSTQVTPLLQAPLTTMKPVAATVPQRTQGTVESATTNQHVNPFTQQQHANVNIPNAGDNTPRATNQQSRSFYDITHPSNAPSNNAAVRSQETTAAEVNNSTTQRNSQQNNPNVQQQQRVQSNTVVAPAAESNNQPAQHNSQQNNPFFQQQQRVQSNTVVAPAAESNNQPTQHNNQQNNPFFQQQQQRVQSNTVVAPAAESNNQPAQHNNQQNNPFFQQQQQHTQSNTVVAPVHTQPAPAPQVQAAPVVRHKDDDNSSQPNNQSNQQSPSSSNSQSQQQSSPAPSYNQGNNNQGGGNGGYHHNH